MLDRIIQFSINKKLIVGVFVFALIGWGSYSITQLPIDAVPDITNNQVQIITTAPSQSAQDIERLVTFPIEQSLATIPEISEVRSFSRFGLSIVTVVFSEHTDVYWARQQIAERMNAIQGLIPPEVGTPALAPMSTGLGEIYQYIIRPKPGYEQKYSIIELRTIQDWIVRRQLLGVEGVADVGSFGGKLKQYEIAIDPQKIRGMKITLDEIYNALSNNNQNTGGGYIDKKPNVYYIRSEGLIRNEEDIQNIAVKTTENGTPLLIKDIGTVKIGFATRYGAMTYNDKGEVVGAVVMMLKGANSSKVIANVKERIAQIEKNLPEGLTIDPFLDRTKLVNNAIQTVSKNLAEGALIVIFILVLFLGNLRAGLIVASVIPLAMLFAISLMNAFGVSGNLMSLGAIDFGLIVDGAVIIVEATMHHLKLRGNVRLSQHQMNQEVYQSASKIRNAAAFGEIIILIVYLPILALIGVEGKMFKPMAQTVSFAIIGAFLLSLTYVPMMSALFLSKTIDTRLTWSDRILAKLVNGYLPVLTKSIQHSKKIVIGSFVAFLLSVFLFNTLGAEFIPALDEGDFAVETRVMLGSSLNQTIEAATKSTKVLLAEFPDEIHEVVSKIGSSEIPTDPMPLEACDLMVILKGKELWTKAKTSSELADKMAMSLEKVAGVSYGFQQPIQMRFNELMTGARQDVVIKVYGEELEKLKMYAEKTEAIIQKVEGVKDIYVEQITGLPQIVVTYNRAHLAKYGLCIDYVNSLINTAFAGKSVGQLFEGEKRFDIMVRLDTANRKSIEDVRSLFIQTNQGIQIPISEIADVQFVSGPNQIQRDDAKRRITVGFNVRGRDVESMVNEIKQKMETNIKFEPGYYPTFGGTFKNLEEAKSRLWVAVPIALLLIFLLLYFTFHSIVQGLLIYTAIPLSAIGGICALWLRDMPFSISAGVGFIALFGVSVLNGIVLIAEFNHLKRNGNTNILDIILKGTATRLRPVIMTAAVASLGFLPMALSHGSGAEVQKPLATVVIGGLLSATLLTLFVLPCLYYLVENRKVKWNPKPLMLFLFISGWITSNAQTVFTISLDSALEVAVKNNNRMQVANKQKEYAKFQKKMASELPKTDVSMMYGQYNGYYKQDNNFSISQVIPFPGEMISKNELGKAKLTAAEFKRGMTKNELVFEVKNEYYALLYFMQQREVLLQADSIFKKIVAVADSKYLKGDGSLLDKSNSTLRAMEIVNQLALNQADFESHLNQFQFLLNTTDQLKPNPSEPTIRNVEIKMDSVSVLKNPYLLYLNNQIAIAEKEKKVAVHNSLPEFKLGYFNQSLFGVPLNESQTAFATSNNRFQGFVVGLSFPLWFAPDVNKSKLMKTQIESTQIQYKQEELTLQTQYKQAIQQYIAKQASLEFYVNYALKNAELVKTQSERAYALGEISFYAHLSNLQKVLQTNEQFNLTVLEYNKSIISIEFFTANQQ